MKHDEARAQLASNPAAIVFAGRDLDTIIAAHGGAYAPHIAGAYSDFQKSLAGADAPTRLVQISDAIERFGAMLAEREEAKIASAEAAEAARREAARRDCARHEADRRAHVRLSTIGPVFGSLRARIMAGEAAVSRAATDAEMLAALDALSADFRSAEATLAVVTASLAA